ncbi:Piwi domain-containing protein [Corynascus novoguineensis]|uniref:Piwi domain-containing protein n=1 Tax=Corynascus novoguineensis TaxID=1126955 RepID=A0AAN7HLS6_9PEZI|nr:Piwi domain-containing protein [Corynascus novoguineensis]
MANNKQRHALAVPEGINKRCDLPPEAYWHPDRVSTPFAVRRGYNTTGQNINVSANQFRIQNVTGRDVYQYDVAIIPEPKGAIVYKKAWSTKAVQGKLAQTKARWLHDDRKLAWSTSNTPGFKLEVDLGLDEGRPGRTNNIFTLEVKQTCKVRLEVLKAYLEKKAGWDNAVLECMSFLDHLLRQGPSERMHLIKRTLVNEYSETKRLNSVTEAIKGIYSAIRLNDSLSSGGIGLGINVDVANQTFWVGQKFEMLARNFLSCMDRKWENLDYQGLRKALLPVKVAGRNGASSTWGMSEAFKALRRLTNIRFVVNHRGKASDTSKQYKVKRIVFDEKYGEFGANAKAVTFDKKMPDGSVRTYSVADFFLQQYKTKLQHWYLPLIESTNAGLFPMEVCEIQRFNPYPFKLDPNQTSEMIKFAVQRPPQRQTQIMKMVQNLEWDKDRYLSHFGVKINSSMAKIPAKLLPNPVIQYGNKPVDPRMTGRWDLRGTKFAVPNPQPLVSWAFVILENVVDRPSAENFSKVFKNVYTGHGGRIAKDPLILAPPKGTQLEDIVGIAYERCGSHFKAMPQLIFYILRDKSAAVYDRLKAANDCHVACLTQMVQAQHVRKAAPQYCSNVSMKVNAKLGGQTSRLSIKANQKPLVTLPTMIIGVDVSHGSTAAGNVSTAAMCVSMDKDMAIYNAAVQTNGWGVEILQPANMHSMLGPLVTKWRNKFNTAPQHVFYLRDGVSEGQFAHVMEFEVDEMRKVFKESIGIVPKITVIVATKRHHIRFFPERGDKNGNCLPGTLVEREVTHPFHYDFYLCSHVAIQGTARPVHYNVIHDECGLKPDDLQRILYHQCYQYCRSTTPVSLHPAVYYAHLAGTRARHHENRSGNAEPMPVDSRHLVLTRPGPMSKSDSKTVATQIEDGPPPPPLLKIGCGSRARPEAVKFFENTMWWV